MEFNTIWSVLIYIVVHVTTGEQSQLYLQGAIGGISADHNKLLKIIHRPQ